MNTFKFLRNNKHAITYPIIIDDPLEQSIYDEGWLAAFVNRQLSSCPYDTGTRDRRLWILGFLDRLTEEGE